MDRARRVGRARRGRREAIDWLRPAATTRLGQGDLERAGIIDERNVFRSDMGLVAALISNFLRIAPRPDEDGYSLNVVHNQRQWAHDVQARACGRCLGQPVYGIAWWISLIGASSVCLGIISSNVEWPLAAFYLLEVMAVMALLLFAAVVGLVEDDHAESSKSSRVRPESRNLHRMRDGGFTCYSGHRCIVTRSAIGWVDDMTQEELAPGTESYYCYRCDFVAAKDER